MTVLARLLDPLWSAAVTATRDEQTDAEAAERAALVQAEADARAEAAAAETTRLRHELDTLTAHLAAAEAARDEQAAQATAAAKDAETARTAAQRRLIQVDRFRLCRVAHEVYL